MSRFPRFHSSQYHTNHVPCGLILNAGFAGLELWLFQREPACTSSHRAGQQDLNDLCMFAPYVVIHVQDVVMLIMRAPEFVDTLYSDLVGTVCVICMCFRVVTLHAYVQTV